MGTSPEPPNLEAHRAELLHVAHWLVPPRLRHRLDPEDLVHQTFVEVLRHPDRLNGKAAAEVFRYLREALRNNALDELRRRDPCAEVPPQELVDSSINLAAWVAADQSSPSRQVERAEMIARLAQAVTLLPDAQRVAIEMRYSRGLRVAEIARLWGGPKALSRCSCTAP